MPEGRGFQPEVSVTGGGPKCRGIIPEGRFVLDHPRIRRGQKGYMPPGARWGCSFDLRSPGCGDEVIGADGQRLRAIRFHPSRKLTNGCAGWLVDEGEAREIFAVLRDEIRRAGAIPVQVSYSEAVRNRARLACAKTRPAERRQRAPAVGRAP